MPIMKARLRRRLEELEISQATALLVVETLLEELERPTPTMTEAGAVRMIAAVNEPIEDAVEAMWRLMVQTAAGGA